MKLKFLVVSDDLMFNHLLMSIIVDLFPDCSLDNTDVFGVWASLLKNRPNVVVVCGHDHDFKGADILREIKANYSGTMAVLEEIAEITEDERVGIDHIWEVPYEHKKFIAAVEKFFHGKEELYGS